MNPLRVQAESAQRLKALMIGDTEAIEAKLQAATKASLRSTRQCVTRASGAQPG